MCGIGGIVVAPGREIDAGVLRRMARALSHRGPDGLAIATHGNAGLVHARLAIVERGPAGAQPTAGPGNWKVVMNGEAFDHMRLRAALPPAAYRGRGDVETVAHALAALGERALERINGFFAIAAIEPQRNRLLLARDRQGVKPLYWAQHAGALLFASEIGALLAAGVPAEPRADAVRHCLARGWVNGPLTLVERVRRVSPGGLLEIDLTTLAVRERLWHDPFATVGRAQEGEAALRLERELEAAVQRRLAADVPVGTLCSGGIDSGLVSAYAARARPGLPAFTASIRDQPRADELPHARAVARRLGLDLHVVPLTAQRWRDALPGVVRRVEHPLTHESAVPLALLARAAREAGASVLLSGEGADELFGGYRSRHVREVAAFAQRDGRPGLRVLPAEAWWMRPGLGPLDAARRWEAGWVARARRAYAHQTGPRRELSALLAADLRTYLPYLLNRLDAATMAAGVEARTPFLDPGVVALALELPLESRIEPRRKALLHDLALRHLPASAVRRPKVGFAFDVTRYFHGARPEFLRDGRLREVVGMSRSAWRAFATAAEAYPLVPWTAEIWCRTVLEGEAPEAVGEALWSQPAAVAA